MPNFPPKPKNEHEQLVQDLAIRLRFENAGLYWFDYDWPKIVRKWARIYPDLSAVTVADVISFLQRWDPPSRTRI